MFRFILQVKKVGKFILGNVAEPQRVEYFGDLNRVLLKYPKKLDITIFGVTICSLFKSSILYGNLVTFICDQTRPRKFIKLNKYWLFMVNILFIVSCLVLCPQA